MITAETAQKMLARITNGDTLTCLDDIRNVNIWSRFAQEALAKEDYQTASACIAVVTRLTS